MVGLNKVSSLLVLFALAAQVSAVTLITLPVNIQLSCTAISNPQGQPSCDAGACAEGKCAYIPAVGVAAAIGSCACVTTTTLPSCRSSLTHVGCEGQCGNGLSCIMTAAGGCQCGQTTTTTTTLQPCHRLDTVAAALCGGSCPRGLSCVMSANGGCGCSSTTTTTLAGCRVVQGTQQCAGSCDNGACLYVPSLSVVGGIGQCICQTTTTTLSTCHYDPERQTCVGACRLGACTYVPSIASAGNGICSCQTTTTSTSPTTTSLKMFVPVNLTLFTTTTTLIKVVATIPQAVLKDSDNDGVIDIKDNCPDKANGNLIGTCTQGTNKGATCMNDIMCGVAIPGPFGGGTPAGHCSMNQEDSDKDGAGDACDPCPYDATDTCTICSSGALPSSFDWRDVKGQNWQSDVKDQAACGACYSESPTGAAEAKYNLEQNKAGNNLDLSEQYFVAPCFASVGSCQGGNRNAVLDHMKNDGVVDNACFPFTSTACGTNHPGGGIDCLPACTAPNVCSNPKTCARCGDWASRRWEINSYAFVNKNDIKRSLVCNGPLSVCSSHWWHCIVLSGWDDGKGVWIIKNSWGTGWGDNGYGEIPYVGDGSKNDHSDFVNDVYYVQGVHKV